MRLATVRHGTDGPSAWLLLLAAALGCGDVAGPATSPDLEAVFRPALEAEVLAVEADWAGRTPGAAGVVEELTASRDLAGASATVRVFSHLVDGFRHHGAVVVPDDAPPGSLPVVVFAHPGDDGVDLRDVLLTVAAIGEPAAGFVFVVPAFRSETLTVGTETFTSEGGPSPWDRDVDDVMALLDVTLEEVPEADAERVAVLGISRGAGVALLLAVRDPRVDLVVELSGPTDFFGPFFRRLVENALDGRLEPLPGLRHLEERFIRPLARGTLSTEEFRLELVRRSVVLFADRLPPVQVHHGRLDAVVDVTQAESLISAVESAGGGPPRDEFFLYPAAGHHPLTMAGAVQRAAAFLQRLQGGGGPKAASHVSSGGHRPPRGSLYQDRMYSQMAR